MEGERASRLVVYGNSVLELDCYQELSDLVQRILGESSGDAHQIPTLSVFVQRAQTLPRVWPVFVLCNRTLSALLISVTYYDRWVLQARKTWTEYI